MTKYISIFMVMGVSFSLLSASTTGAAVEATFPNQPTTKQKNNISNKNPIMAFTQTGIIREIDFAKRSMIVSGKEYFYNPSTKFKSFESNFLSIQSLHEGDRVGLTYASVNKNQRVLSSVWKIPAKLTLPFPIDQ